ncbi:hypothetical protein TWF281_004334 [Arthrobotrys megalospora]
MEGAASSFYHSARNIRGDPQPEVAELLESELSLAKTRIARRRARTREFTGDLLADSGDLITYLLELLDEVATNISRGNKMRLYLDRKVNNWDDETDLTDLDSAHHLNVRRLAFIKICEELKTTSTNINQLWETTLSRTQPDPPPPSFRHSHTLSPGPRRSSVPSSSRSHSQGSPLDSSLYPRVESRHTFHQPNHYIQTSPPAPLYNDWQPTEDFSDLADSEGHNEEDTSEYLDLESFEDMDVDRSGAAYQVRRGPTSPSTSLSSPGTDPSFDLDRRGTGNYTCPEGMHCKKGGVYGDDLVIFRRNCEFKRHLQKHEKPFKCDEPGCPNKSGFARSDQLRRHKINVHRVQVY